MVLPQCRNFVFTDYYCMDLLTLCETALPTRIKFIIFQLEECPETKQFHLQGYCETVNPMRYPEIKLMLHEDSLHIEDRKGTQKEAIDYCRKSESRIAGPWSFGCPSIQGWRGDLQEIRDELVNSSYDDAFLKYPSKFIQYGKGLKEYNNILIKQKMKGSWIDRNVCVRWGDPGTGKTRWVKENFNYFEPVINESRVWFDGYNGEDTILLDEFKWERYNLEDLLKLCDGYNPVRVETKGGSIILQHTNVFIVGNSDPAFWYGSLPSQLRRRIKDIKRFQHLPAVTEVPQGNTDTWGIN